MTRQWNWRCKVQRHSEPPFRDARASIDNRALLQWRSAIHGNNLPHQQVNVGKRIVIIASALTDTLRMLKGSRKSLHKGARLLAR